MLVTIDVLRLARRRDTLRLLRRPNRFFTEQPAFARAMLRARRWRSADFLEVAVIAAWEEAPAQLAMTRTSEVWRGVFEVQRTHGTLHGDDPLGPAADAVGGAGAILTAGNVRLRRVPAFLSRNQKVVHELNRAPGLREAFGVMGFWRGGPWMCTLSLWDDLDAGLGFAYRNSPHHQEAVKRMRSGAFGTRESYFARLALVESVGTLDGRAPFASLEPVAA